MPKRASRTESAVVVVVVRLGEVADRAVVALGAGCGAPIASPRLRIDMKFGTCSSSYFRGRTERRSLVRIHAPYVSDCGYLYFVHYSQRASDFPPRFLGLRRAPCSPGQRRGGDSGLVVLAQQLGRLFPCTESSWNNTSCYAPAACGLHCSPYEWDPDGRHFNFNLHSNKLGGAATWVARRVQG